MTQVYSKIYISGIEETDAYSYYVAKSISTNNSTSNFEAVIDNFQGVNGSKFNLGVDVNIYADTNAIVVDGTGSSSQKIFTGILENITYEGEPLYEHIKLSGRDYLAKLADRTVKPITFTNQEIGSIVRNIVSTNTQNIGSTGIQTVNSIGSRISFNYTPVFDAVNQLATLSNSIFYVDVNKNFHFEPPASVNSGYTFNGSNILKATFEQRRDTIYNQIWVYGDRYLDGFKETFTAGAGGGSVYTLTYVPSNTQVTVNGSIIQPGQVANSAVTPASGNRYIVSSNDKTVTFLSGTSYGNNIPTNGSTVIIDYKRSLPVAKAGDNFISQGLYGIREKFIQDKNIKDPQTAMALVTQELTNNSIPVNEGNLDIIGVVNVTPSQTAVIDLPFQNVLAQTYQIIEAKYDFNKENNLAGEVLSIKVNKKLNDVTDSIKQLILDLKKLQAGDISASDVLTRMIYSAGSQTVRESGINVYTQMTNDTFIDSSPSRGVLGIVNPATVGSIVTNNISERGYWRFEGSPIIDSVQGDLATIISGAGNGFTDPTFSTSVSNLGSAIQTPGSPTYVLFTTNTNRVYASGAGSFGPFTLSYWVYPPNIGGVGSSYLLHTSGSFTNSTSFLSSGTSTTTILPVVYDKSSTTVTFSGNTGYTLNAWNRTVWSFAGSPGSFNCYLNGSLVGARDSYPSAQISALRLTEPKALFRLTGVLDSWCVSGLMLDDVKWIVGSAWTLNDVQLDFNNGSGFWKVLGSMQWINTQIGFTTPINALTNQGTTNNYISITPTSNGSIYSQSSYSGLAISTWVQISGVGRSDWQQPNNHIPFLAKASGGNFEWAFRYTSGVALNLTGSVQVDFVNYTSGNSGTNVVLSAYPLSNTWSHLVGNILNNGSTEIYLNGSFIQSTSGGNFNQLGSSNIRIFGASYASNTLIGNMALTRIYNRGLASTEVGSIYSWEYYNFVSGQNITSGLIGYWKLGENTGNFAWNSVSSGTNSGNFIQPLLGDRRGNKTRVYTSGDPPVGQYFHVMF